MIIAPKIKGFLCIDGPSSRRCVADVMGQIDQIKRGGPDPQRAQDGCW